MSSYANIAFTTIREDWNVYRLENGTILKMKPTLASLIGGEGGQNEAQIQAVIALEPVAEDKGTPSVSIQVGAADVIGEVTFTIDRQVTEIYETQKSSLILLFPVLGKLQRTNKFDQNGFRIYSTGFTIGLGVIPPPNEAGKPAQPAIVGTQPVE